VVLSLYKVFGFPDLGVLLVRKPAEDLFMRRKYFGGGTVDMVVCGKQQWHASKAQTLHERLEDGTLPFHNIVAAGIALETHRSLFGSMDHVGHHTSRLANYLRQGLQQLKHANGSPVVVQYGLEDHDPTLGKGPIVAFNIRNCSGAWVSLTEFEKLSNLKKIYVRTGGMCSPGGVASALGLEPWEMRRNFSAGFRCGAEDDIVAGKPTGAIRASFGPMSTLSDVTRFLDFLTEFFVEETADETLTREDSDVVDSIHGRSLRVKSVTVFPIKSCGGYTVPCGVDWEVKPEGLAWDREWCLVHRGSGQALSQKRYPMMALLQPTIDFAAGSLRVEYYGTVGEAKRSISVPLVEDPHLFEAPITEATSRVCGEPVAMMRYASDHINNFFSEVLGVPCVLSRFPAGGRGMASRNSKARLQSHQRRKQQRLPGSFPGVPSPPDSDTEIQQSGKILLSNESPILMIYTSSVAELNNRISDSGANPVPDSTFRANLVLEPTGSDTAPSAYAEDSWGSIQVGSQRYKLLGACRRCQMVCVDQATGHRGQEPLSTLAKTRRFDGKVYFGVHMRHEPWTSPAGNSRTTPYIRVGELVGIGSQER
jgi:molybdenum cofactor sulfurtransferase